MSTSKTNRGWLRSIAAVAFVTATGFAVSAQAGECPAGKSKPNAREAVNLAAVGVTDTTLGAIDLEKEPAQIKDRQLRFRKLTIAPNGIVPWHSHVPTNRTRALWAGASHSSSILREQLEVCRVPPKSFREALHIRDEGRGKVS
jgi:hypothetical protein